MDKPRNWGIIIVMILQATLGLLQHGSYSIWLQDPRKHATNVSSTAVFVGFVCFIFLGGCWKSLRSISLIDVHLLAAVGRF
jgi:hypothetical protein